MDYKKRTHNVKRFAYDVLFKTLSKYDLPEILLQVEVGEENKYPHSTDVLTVSAGVIATALNSRDKWKRIFKSQQERSVLNDMEKLDDFLEKNAFLSKTTDIAPDNRIRRSLAFFSELILFLHSNSIGFDFGNILDIWSKYFHEKIAANVDPTGLLGELFFEDVFIVDYLAVVDYFIEDVAKPYGEIDGVSGLFRDFSEELEKFSPDPLSDKNKLEQKIQLARDYIETLLKNRNSNKIPEESVSYLSGIFQRDLVMPGHRKSLEQPQHSSSLPSTIAEEVDDKKEKNIGKVETRPVGEDKTPNYEKPQ